MAPEPETFLQEIKRYTGFGDSDERALAALHAHAKPHFRAIADEFYDKLSRHPEAARVFDGPAQVGRLKVTMQAWLDRLLTGPWDADYFEQRSRIGRMHVEVALPQRYMFTAMNVIRLHLDGIATSAFAAEPETADRARRALARVLDMELAIMLETYREEYTDRVQRVERRERAELEGRLAVAQARYIGIDVTDERALERRTHRAEQLAALGTLAAGLAHEIRNPLNAAQLQLMLIERRLAKPGDEHRSNSLAAARVVKNELGRLGGLVQDFLAFARPSELRLEQADLAATLANVAQLVAPAAAEAGVKLIAPANTREVSAMYDEERVKQVLLNLVRNAVEAADRGGEVRIGIESDGSQTTIEVEDTGPGLPKGINVFEPFATTKDGGTGLGLPIVHRIVSDHGGAVDVTRRGDCTIFAVHLPIAGP